MDDRHILLCNRTLITQGHVRSSRVHCRTHPEKTGFGNSAPCSHLREVVHTCKVDSVYFNSSQAGKHGPLSMWQRADNTPSSFSSSASGGQVALHCHTATCICSRRKEKQVCSVSRCRPVAEEGTELSCGSFSLKAHGSASLRGDKHVLVTGKPHDGDESALTHSPGDAVIFHPWPALSTEAQL